MARALLLLCLPLVACGSATTAPTRAPSHAGSEARPDVGVLSISTRGTVFGATSFGSGESSAALDAVVDSAANDLPCTEPIKKVFVGDKSYTNGSGRPLVVDACGERVTYVEACHTVEAADDVECHYVLTARMPLMKHVSSAP